MILARMATPIGLRGLKQTTSRGRKIFSPHHMLLVSRDLYLPLKYPSLAIVSDRVLDYTDC